MSDNHGQPPFRPTWSVSQNVERRFPFRESEFADVRPRQFSFRLILWCCRRDALQHAVPSNLSGTAICHELPEPLTFFGTQAAPAPAAIASVMN